MPDSPVLVDLNGLRLSLLVDPKSFSATLEQRVKAAGGGAFDLEYATQVAQNLEAVKVAVAWVRRHAMLDENLRVGNGAEIARRSGLRRSRAHAMMNRAVHERVHGVTLADVLGENYPSTTSMQ